MHIRNDGNAERTRRSKTKRLRLLLLLVIFGGALVWAGPATVCAKYLRYLVFRVGSNDSIDWKVKHVFIVGASATWYKPLLRMTGDTEQHGERVTYYFWYHGHPRMEGARSAGIVVDTNKNAIVEVRTESWLR